MLARMMLCCVQAVVFCGLAYCDDPDFVRDVQPILQQHCVECHGPEKQHSGLRLDRRSSMLRGGDYGVPAVVPGEPDQSFMLELISGSNADGIRMPPEGDLLSVAARETLHRWVAVGAVLPGQMQATASDIEHDLWSLQPLTPFPSQIRNPTQCIDEHIAAKLAAAGLSMSVRADAVTLLRRVSLVLTGLPPTPEELQDYLDDADGPELAYVKAVDRLLASPRYGERWAQHWLDVIRWAETVGFETNAERPHAWPYRDWVIEALNQDKPYDQFLVEQIAGDTLGQDAALGFLVAGPANLPGQIGRDEEAMRQARQDELDEVIRTVSESIMGLTVGCARCHNHKFDPILQRDYYSLQAVFAGLSYGDRRWRGPQNDQWTAAIPQASQRLQDLQHQAQSLRQELGLQPATQSLQTERFAARTTQAVRMEIAATADGRPASLYEIEAWHVDNVAGGNVALAARGAVPSASSFALENQTRHFDNLIDGTSDRRQAFPWVSGVPGPAWIQINFAKPEQIDRIVWEQGSSQPVDYTIKVLEPDGLNWQVVADTQNRWLREDDTRPASVVYLPQLSLEQITSIVELNAKIRAARAELNRLSAGPQVFAATFSAEPPTTWLLHRGDPMNRRQPVVPDIPQVLGNLELKEDATDAQRRLALARHLTGPDHPLTARVLVNRVWQHHFGAGFIDTPSDLGTMGSPPTHPQLLDMLTAEFIDGGWSLKKLHRWIVMSETFRQASYPQWQALDRDAESRLLWRYPPRRLEAEAIRDSILQTSGQLNLQMGGAGFNLFHQRGGLSDYTALETFDAQGWRRMIYGHKIRMQAVDVFGAFDCPDAGQMNPKRPRSITPTQSLGLFNSPFVLRQADFFAERIRTEVGDQAPAQVCRAFEIALARKPAADEQVRMEAFVAEAGLGQLCRVLMNSSEFLYIQ